MEKRIAILGIIIEDTEVVSKVNELMETRVAVMSIIEENPDSVEKLNAMLHEYGPYIIGRMGMPYKEKNISVISIVMDAPNDVISALSGKLGMLEGVSAKAVYSKKQKCKKKKATYKTDRKKKIKKSIQSS